MGNEGLLMFYQALPEMNMLDSSKWKVDFNPYESVPLYVRFWKHVVDKVSTPSVRRVYMNGTK